MDFLIKSKRFGIRFLSFKDSTLFLLEVLFEIGESFNGKLARLVNVNHGVDLEGKDVIFANVFFEFVEVNLSSFFRLHIGVAFEINLAGFTVSGHTCQVEVVGHDAGRS